MENVCSRKKLVQPADLSIRLLLCARVGLHVKEPNACTNTQIRMGLA